MNEGMNGLGEHIYPLETTLAAAGSQLMTLSTGFPHRGLTYFLEIPYPWLCQHMAAVKSNRILCVQVPVCVRACKHFVNGKGLYRL